VLRDLVLVATAEAENAGVWDSLATLKEAIQTLWGVDVEVEELRDVREVLVDEGRARRTEGGLTVSADTLGELESTKEESANIRLAAFGEWEEWVRRSRPDLSDEEFSALVVDLTAWLDRIIARHGVEAALVIYPENPRAQAVFDEIEGLGFDFLPDRGRRVREVRESAFPAFVRAPTAAQRRFLVDRLDVAYFLTVLTLTLRQVNSSARELRATVFTWTPTYSTPSSGLRTLKRPCRLFAFSNSRASWATNWLSLRGPLRNFALV